MVLFTTAAAGALAETRPISFNERMVAAESVELVYHDLRTGAAKPAFSQALPSAVLRRRTEDVIRQTRMLSDRYGQIVAAEDLQAELDRMASHSKDPLALESILKSLAWDGDLAAEVLARPLIVDRKLRASFAFDSSLHLTARSAAESFRSAVTAASFLGRAGTNGQRVKWRVDPARCGIIDDEGALLLSADEFRRQRSRFPLAVGEISPVVETADSYVVEIAGVDSSDRFEGAVAVFPKRSFDDWYVEVRAGIPLSFPTNDPQGRPVPFSYTVPAVLSACAEAWNSGVLGQLVPDPRYGHSAVWTGAEMIVWGGSDGIFSLRTGGRYDPATDAWAPTSVGNGVPSARYDHSAVWAGSLGEMIVWGGAGGSITGGRYNPLTDSWKATPTVAPIPSARTGHSAVWTGTEMIVWGGVSGGARTNTGGRFNPSSGANGSWSLTGIGFNVPSARDRHGAVWSSATSNLLIWGGDTNAGPTSTGSRYNPGTNTWTSISSVNGPSARGGHSAVFDGSRMIVWGGAGVSGPLSSGSRYNPSSDSWTVLPVAGSPPSARQGHLAVWTGSQMLVWGGVDSAGAVLDNGGRFDSSSSSWFSIAPSAGHPGARTRTTAVWAQNKMIVWGGQDAVSSTPLSTGGRFDPVSELWSVTNLGAGAPSSRSSAGSVFTGAEMIVWGGIGPSGLAGGAGTGGRYRPATDSWATVTVNDAPTSRFGLSALWTGREMIVWGGTRVDATGGRYDPVFDQWKPTAVAGAPLARDRQSAVWSGREVILWGGRTGVTPVPTSTGGRYDPYRDVWSQTADTATPSARFSHSAAWGGGFMTIWGGQSNGTGLADGARYDPSTDSWIDLDPRAPAGRFDASTVWTGSRMIVWGGTSDGVDRLSDGGSFDPAGNAWQSMSLTGAAAGRTGPTAVWSGSEMIVWGGSSGSTDFADGARYDPAANSWKAMTGTGAPRARSLASGVWTGTGLAIWGGTSSSFGPLGDGGKYDPTGAIPQIAGPDVVCLGSSGILDAGPGFTSYSWSTGASTRTVTVTPAQTTTFTCAVDTAGGCSATRSKTVFVTVPEGPDISGIATICAGTITEMTAEPGYSPYQWYLAGNPISGETGTTYTSGAPGVYTASGTGKWGCDSMSKPFVLAFGSVAPPAVGSTLHASKGAGSSLIFTWIDASNASGYEVVQDVSLSGSFAAVVGGAPSGAPGLTTSNPGPSGPFFRVRATNSCGTGPSQ